MSNSRFDDIFSAATQFNPIKEESSPPPQTQKTKAQSPARAKSPKVSKSVKTRDFWANFESKDDRIRLNVDISNSLNDRLSAKAKELGQPKTELVRRLIEWALEENNE